MCRTCGCDNDQEYEHEHEHDHAPLSVPFVELPVPILEKNDAAAARNRERFARAGVLALNVVGTPGAGKTALVGATIDRLRDLGLEVGAVVADLATENDARRLERPGVPVIGLETGTTCHLTAPLLERALGRIPLDRLDVLFIENVGNLVCPALFDLGEAAKVALVSVTEGDDKPEKYPVMFRNAALFAITKIDLLPYVDFDLEAAAAFARRVNPEIDIVALSARTGEGVEPWLDWIQALRRATSAGATAAKLF